MTLPDVLLGRHDVATGDDMEDLGRRIGANLAGGDLVVLTGPLGAGKTTLTRGIADGLGVRGPVQSPTFVIARTHPSLVGGAPLVHADAYRLGSAMELDDLDIDGERSAVVVEWGRGLAEGLRDVWWEVEIERPVGGRVGGGGAGGVGGDAGGGETVESVEGGEDALDDDAPRVVTITRRTA